MAPTDQVATHTAGPWALRECYEFIDDETDSASGRLMSAQIVSVVDPFGVQRVAYVERNQTTIADARLIAAAPDLLVACKAALNDRMFKDWPGIAALLMDAIAKAEGAHE